MNCWQTLGIDETTDKRAIKRAYAKQLKLNNPEDDPVAFQNLREAYDYALQLADYAQYDQEEDVDETFQNNEILAFSSNYEQVHPEQTYSDHTSSEKTGSEQTPIAEVELSEKDKIRQQQAETINKYLDQLVPVLQQDEQQAIKHCQRLLNEDYYQALDVRYEFEGRLILALLQNSLYSFNFTLFLAETFDWDINLNRPGNLFNNHFDNDTRFSGAFYRFVQPFLIDLIRRDFNKTLSNWHPGVEPETIATLDNLLFFETNTEGLESFFKQRKHKALAQSAFKHLTSNSFVTPYSSVVPHNTTKWLLDNKIIKEDPLNFSQAGTEESSNKKSSIPFWVIWLVLFVIIRGVFALLNNDDSEINNNEISEIIITNPNAQGGALLKSIMVPRAENGDAEAQFWLGYSYLRGENSLEKNNELALSWIQKSANQEHAPAEELLGILYMSGEAGERNDNLAIDYLSKAAAKDRPDANYWLAQYFYRGQAVELNISYADELLNKAAELGSSRGLRQLGTSLVESGDGQEDINQGLRFLQQASDLGNLGATRQIAVEYLNGEHVEKDYSIASELLIRIKDENWPPANFLLSQIYLKGLGVQPDYRQYQTLLGQTKRRASVDDINNFAWAIVTSPNKELRNGQLALDLMNESLDNPSNITSVRVDTLAAAYAEIDDFDNAIIQQKRAIDLLPANSSVETRDDFESRLRKYQNGLKVTD